MSDPSGFSRAGMSGIVLGTGAIALAYGLAFVPGAVALAPWLLAAGIIVLVISLLWLGAVRGGTGRLSRILSVTALSIVALLLGAGFGAALLSPDPGPGSALLLGLPRGAAMLLYGIGLAPALILPVVYALTFEPPSGK